MQNQNDSLTMARFLAAMSPVITETVKKALRSYGARVEEHGFGLGTILVIKSGKKRADFHLNNLFLEIATMDRDERPLRFDERLRDFDFFLSKTNQIVQSKLNVLAPILSEEDPEIAIEKIKELANQYERVRIWKFDQNKPI